MNKPAFLKLWSVAVGAMDAVTGLLLIFATQFTLGMLGITPPSADAMVFLGWIGVFVMSVGLSYGLALLGTSHGEAVWSFTAIVRIAVAAFLSARMLDGSLEIHWMLVAITDAAVACAQFYMLRAGWWKEVPR